MSIVPPKCECSGPGWCHRHGCEKIEALWKLCERPDFWGQFEAGLAPQQRPEAAASRPSIPNPAGPEDFPCIHRGQEIGILDCKPCCGTRTLPIYECSINKSCTINAHGRPSVEYPPHVCLTCEQKATERIVIENNQCPGDVAVLAGAIRALAESYPGRYAIAIRTSCDALFEHSPYVQKLHDGHATSAMHVEATYGGVQFSGQRPIHFLQAFCDDLAKSLQLPALSPQDWTQPAIFLSDEEKSWHSQVREITGDDRPFWIVNAGIKIDYTAKKWNGWQEVIDATRDAVQWVQIGSPEHRHPNLTGVIDLRGKTDLRQLVRLVYRAQGVLCGVTALMHLAHWVERGPHNQRRRHAVVICGGREPPSWFRYPAHQVFNTIGDLDCCASSGCWKSRVLAEADGDQKDKDLCIDPVGDIGRCMTMIDPIDVAATVRRLANG